MFTRITMIDHGRRTLRQRRDARRSCGPYTWTPAKPGTGRGFYSSSRNELECDDHGSTFRLRLEYARDHVGTWSARVHSFGCCEYGGDTFTPLIARLPRGRGYLAGWTLGAGMAGSLDAHVYESPSDAAYAAYDDAKWAADAEREYREGEMEGDAA